MSDQRLTDTAPASQIDPKSATRLSLTTIFTVTFVSVLLIFVSITALSYIRMADFRQILDEIAITSLPNVVVLEQLNNNIASLSSISNGLTNAKSEPSLRIAEAQIENKLRVIRLLAEQQAHDNFMFAQFNAITQELFELRELASQRLHLAQQLANHQQNLYTLNDQVTNLAIQTQPTATVSQLDLDQVWRTNFFEAAAMTSRGLNSERLQTIRQLSFKVRVILDNLNHKTDTFSGSQREQRLALIQQLKNILVEKNGIFPLRIKLLRLSGRVTGRGNFVHNLIMDYLRFLNFKSYQLSDSVITQTRLASHRVGQQIQFIGLFVVTGLLFLMLIVFFIQNRVVRRLVQLNNLVQDRAIGKSNTHIITGNDEISDIAETFGHFAVTIEQQKQALQALSLQDGLTGIPNRRALDESLKHELQLAIRQKWSISLLMIDIDYFKPYNDNYGHAAGDETLKKVAKILADNLPRSTDFVARYGGEEFVCILPDTSSEGAIKVATSILAKVEEAAIEHKYNPDKPLLTISLGVVTSNKNDTRDADTLLKLVDHALYAAKQKGRNQIVRYEELVS